MTKWLSRSTFSLSTAPQQPLLMVWQSLEVWVLLWKHIPILWEDRSHSAICWTNTFLMASSHSHITHSGTSHDSFIIKLRMYSYFYVYCTNGLYHNCSDHQWSIIFYTLFLYRKYSIVPVVWVHALYIPANRWSETHIPSSHGKRGNCEVRLIVSSARLLFTRWLIRHRCN